MTAPGGGLRRALHAVLALATLLPVAGDVLAEQPIVTHTAAAVVSARPITSFHPTEPGRTRFGELEFLGGLVLTSDHPGFLGLSALLTRDRGRELLSGSDEGRWFVARLKTDDAGRPQAIEEALMAPLLDADGKPFGSKWESDSESLTLRRGPDGDEVLVGLEGHHRVLSYRTAGDWRALADARARPVPGIPRDITTLRANRGLEAMAVAPAASPIAGALVLLAEEPRHGEVDQPAWIVGGPRPGRFHLARRDDFAVTDAGFLPDGDLIVLQRRFGLRHGLGMRLLRVAAKDIAPGRVVEGREMLTADWGWEIDNMEGLAVDTAPDGRTILTLISDDNGNWFQRTILLRFRLLDRP